MANKILNARIQNAVYTEAQWSAEDPVLQKGELAFSSDKGYIYKVGDGTSKWSALSYAPLNFLPLTGGTLTGNLVGRYITGTWLRSTENNASANAATKICIQDSEGWIYTRTPAQILSDMGVTATAAELNYVDGVTSNIQTQFTNVNTKLNSTIKDLSIEGKVITYTKTNGTTGTLTTQDTNTTYSVMLGASSSADGKSGLVPQPTKGNQGKFLRGDGAWAVPTDTKNTAGSTNSSSKLFLIGATSQGANPQTYSNANVYISSTTDSEGKTYYNLYSNGIQVVNLSDAQALTNKTYNGYTLAAACAKGVTDSTSAGAISTGSNLVTERDVYYGLPTINGSHSYTSGTNIYAPTTAGTSDYVLKSSGSGAPTWMAQSSITAGKANTWTNARNFTIKDHNSSHSGTAVSVNGSQAITLLLPSTIKATLDGNASTATSAGKWTTARNFTIKDSDSTNAGTAVSVDGSGAITLLLPSTIKATLSGNASTATQVYGTLTNPTDTNGTTYAIPFHTDVSSSNKSLRNNDGLRYIALQGTTTSGGWGILVLGNGTTSGTSGNKRGNLRLYSSSSGYGQIYQADTTSGLKHVLPATAGTILNTGTTSASRSYSTGLSIGSVTINSSATTFFVPNAGSNQAGVVSTAAQTFAGAKTFTGAATFNGGITGTLTGNASSATKAYTTVTNPSTGTTYALPFIVSSSSSGNQSLLVNDGFKYYTKEGTTSATGNAELGLGNNIASGTAGNKVGKIYMYGTSSGYTYIAPSNNTTSNITVNLPSTGGTLALTTSNVASATTLSMLALSSNSNNAAAIFNPYTFTVTSAWCGVSGVYAIHDAENTFSGIFSIKFRVGSSATTLSTGEVRWLAASRTTMPTLTLTHSIDTTNAKTTFRFYISPNNIYKSYRISKISEYTSGTTIATSTSTVSSITGTTYSTANSITVNKAVADLDDYAINRSYVSLRARNEIPANANLNTANYIKVGTYYCANNANATTLKNCPTAIAFMMHVYAPINTTIDDETTSQYRYRIRKIINISGEEWISKVSVDATVGQLTYGGWSKIITSGGHIETSNGYLKSTANGNTVTIGSQNATWCHFQNSANIPFHFNKAIHAQDGFTVYGASVPTSLTNGKLTMDKTTYNDGYIELSGTTPFIDFHYNDSTDDYSVRLICNGQDTLDIFGGSLYVGGTSDTTWRASYVRNQTGAVGIHVAASGNAGVIYNDIGSTSGDWMMYRNKDNNTVFIPNVTEISTTMANNVPLTIKSGNATSASIEYKNSSGTVMGYLGVDSNKNAVFNDTSNTYNIIHGGNYSSYALPKTGGTLKGALTVLGKISSGNTSTNGGIDIYHDTPYLDFHFGNSSSDYTTRIIEKESGKLTIQASNVITSGNVWTGASTDNTYHTIYARNKYGSGGIHVSTASNVGLMNSGISTWIIRMPSDGVCRIAEKLVLADNFHTEKNNQMTLGTPSYKWKQLYAATATINTSDRNDKKDFRMFDSNENYEKFFMDLKPMVFKFKNGESGRDHFGFVSQDVEESLYKFGFNDKSFAGFCKDAIIEEIEGEDGVTREVPKLDEDGNEQYVYGLRYSEFTAMNTYMIQKLYNKIESLENEIKLLKKS